MDGDKRRTIGVLAPYLVGYFYGSLISAIQTSVGERGGRVIAMMTAPLGGDLARGPTPERLAPVAWEHLDAVVCIANGAPSAYLQAVMDAGMPVVTLSHHHPGLACPAVLADNRGGVASAVAHLVEHGHRRIAFAGCFEQFDVRERYAAYQESMRAHNIEPDPAWYFEAPDNLEPGGAHAARSMLAAGLPCTAVVAGDDLNAVGIMSAVHAAGFRVPVDLAVVGFDDIPGIDMFSPSLSTVSPNLALMGDLAVELAFRRLNGEEGKEGKEGDNSVHVVDATVVVR